MASVVIDRNEDSGFGLVALKWYTGSSISYRSTVVKSILYDVVAAQGSRHGVLSRQVTVQQALPSCFGKTGLTGARKGNLSEHI